MHYAPDNFQDVVKAAQGMAKAIHGQIGAIGKRVYYHDLAIKKHGAQSADLLPDIPQSEIDFVYRFIEAVTGLEPDAKEPWQS
jgi:hypothetical protein